MILAMFLNFPGFKIGQFFLDLHVLSWTFQRFSAFQVVAVAPFGDGISICKVEAEEAYFKIIMSTVSRKK